MSNDIVNPSKRPRVDSSASRSVVRSTQRLPLSCIVCARRKIKCDRSIPCRPCLDRGDELTCRREEVSVKGELQNGSSTIKQKTFEQLSREVEELSFRVQELERGVKPASRNEISTYTRPPSPSEIETTRLPGIMEEAALGIGETSRWNSSDRREPNHHGNAHSHWYTPKSLESCLAVLPSQAQARSLVNLYEDSAGWVTGSIQISTLLKGQDRFWLDMDTYNIRDDMWLAVYFAVLSASAFFVEEDSAKTMNLTVPQLRDMGQACFDAAVATIYRLDGLTQPSVFFCQTVQTLGPAFHFTSNTSLHRSLSAVSCSHARSLNLHLRGTAKVNDQENDRDMEPLLWWNIVEPDWSFLPYNRYCTISPRHFTTTMAAKDLDTPPAALAYRIVCFRAARVLFDLFGDLSSHQDPPYEDVVTASKRIQEIKEDLDANRHTGLGHRSPRDNRSQRYLLDMTIAYRDYQCHRLYFVKALADSRYARSYTACMQAAETISRVSELLTPPYLLMWNTTVMVVAAGIILALDYVFTPSSTNVSQQHDREAVVSGLVNRLRQLNDKSGIATRGVTLIDHLIVLGTRRHRGQMNEVTITREALMQLVASSHSSGVPGMLWDPSRTDQGPHHDSPSLWQGSIDTEASVQIVSGDQPMWNADFDGLFDNDIGLDFAQLLGQIMPNTG